MGYKIVFHPRAIKILKNLDLFEKRKIQEKIKKIVMHPKKSGSMLKYTNLRKERVEDYRIIYRIDNIGKAIVILKMGHRKNVYDNFTILLM